jgi:hypothetical protein
VFERFTEKARRSVFFARYDASVYPTSFIEPEHLFLGILREYSELARRLPVEEFRARISQKFPKREGVSTTVDMPLAKGAKQAMASGAEASDRLGHRQIDCGHLVLGLIQSSSFVAQLLSERGINAAAVEEMLATPRTAFEPPGLIAGMPVVARLLSLVLTSESKLFRFSESEAEDAVGQKRWSRKEALGHLIDHATTHLHWLARALTESKPVFAGVPQDDWMEAMGYRTRLWGELIPLWISLNHMLAHSLGGVSSEKMEAMVRVGIQPPVTFSTVSDRYVTHCEDVIAEILTLGHASTFRKE